MKIKQLKKELVLSNTDIAEFFDMNPNDLTFLNLSFLVLF